MNKSEPKHILIDRCCLVYLILQYVASSPPLFFVFPKGIIMKIRYFLTCIIPSLPQYF